jgi:hypothetical protein
MAGLDPATQGCCAHIFTGFDHAACTFQAAILGGRVKPGHDEFYLVAASPAMTNFMPWQHTGPDETCLRSEILSPFVATARD